MAVLDLEGDTDQNRNVMDSCLAPFRSLLNYGVEITACPEYKYKNVRKLSPGEVRIQSATEYINICSSFEGMKNDSIVFFTTSNPHPIRGSDFSS